MTTQNKRRIGIMLTVAFLLLLPFTAMQFTDEVHWTLSDFVIAGALLLSTGFMIDLVITKVKNTRHRVAICVGLLAVLFLVWIELAVGVFGTPFAGQ